MKLSNLTPVLNDLVAALDGSRVDGFELFSATREPRHPPPTDEPWGMREFHLVHPDRHTFRVSAESGH